MSLAMFEGQIHLVSALNELDGNTLLRVLIPAELDEAERARVEILDLRVKEKQQDEQCCRLSIRHHRTFS